MPREEDEYENDLEDYMEESLMAEAGQMGIFTDDGQDVYTDALKRVDEAV